MAEKRKIQEYKIKEIKNLTELIDGNNTIMIASIKGLPTKNFQKIKKQFKGKAVIKIIKKRVLIRSVDYSKKLQVKNLKNYLNSDVALLLSNIEPFELATELNERKTPVKAKSGQIVDKDIEIEAGMTELPAGPALSELGGVGLQVKVTNGKIEIMQPKVIIKKGQIISEEIARVMGKLEITPFKVGFVPLVAFDTKFNKTFTTLVIDKDKLINDLRNMFAKSRAFAVSLGYISRDIIGLLLAKALANEKALSYLIKEEVSENVKTEEENIENTQNNKKVDGRESDNAQQPKSEEIE